MWPGLDRYIDYPGRLVVSSRLAAPIVTPGPPLGASPSPEPLTRVDFV